MPIQRINLFLLPCPQQTPYRTMLQENHLFRPHLPPMIFWNITNTFIFINCTNSVNSSMLRRCLYCKKAFSLDLKDHSVVEAIFSHLSWKKAQIAASEKDSALFRVFYSIKLLQTNSEFVISKLAGVFDGICIGLFFLINL